MRGSGGERYLNVSVGALSGKGLLSSSRLKLKRGFEKGGFQGGKIFSWKGVSSIPARVVELNMRFLLAQSRVG